MAKKKAATEGTEDIQNAELESSPADIPTPQNVGDNRADFVCKQNRDKYGLLEHVNYVFDENTGLVDWRRMLRPEHLAINKEKFPEGVDPQTIDVTTVEDSKLIILLPGIKYLAQIRGYRYVNFNTVNASLDHAIVKCTIGWIPNFEAGIQYGDPVLFEAIGEAHLNNTKDFSQDFLVAIAENRAFVRAVRNFLRIHVVASEELGKDKTEKRAIKQDEKNKNLVEMVEALVEAKGLTFDRLKKRLADEGHEKADEWTKVAHLPKNILLDLSGRLKKLPDKA